MEDPTNEFLESLTLLGGAAPERKPGRQRVSYTHKDMADYILANPTASGWELAQRYGYTPSTVSLILNSDAFKSYLASRREELVNPILIATVEDRMRNVAVRSLDLLAEKLEAPANMVSDELVLRAATMSSKALGMGIAAPPPPPPSVNLDDLAERLASLARRPQAAVDVEAREIR